MDFNLKVIFSGGFRVCVLGNEVKEGCLRWKEIGLKRSLTF